MKTLIFTIFFFLFPFNCFCQTIDRASINYKGTKGIFFSEAIGDKILADLELYKVSGKQIELLELKILKLENKLELVQLNLKLTEDIVKEWKLVSANQVILAKNSEDKYVSLRDKQTKWYRSPTFWLGVGIIVGGSMAVGITFGLRKAEGY